MRLHKLSAGVVQPISFKACIKTALSLLIGLLVPFYRTFAFYLLWNWFAVEILHAGISYWQANGGLSDPARHATANSHCPEFT